MNASVTGQEMPSRGCRHAGLSRRRRTARLRGSLRAQRSNPPPDDPTDRSPEAGIASPRSQWPCARDRPGRCGMTRGRVARLAPAARRSHALPGQTSGRVPHVRLAAEYTPPKVWTWNKPSGGHFANINRPVSGATHDKELPVGKHPLQLYSLGTPNGVKVTVMLEELLAAGHKGAEYDAWLIRINEGDQFGSGYVAITPNSKIPALVDRSGPEAHPGVRNRRHPAVSGGEIRRIPAGRAQCARAECLSWLFWQMGSARRTSAVGLATSTPTRR